MKLRKRGLAALLLCASLAVMLLPMAAVAAPKPLDLWVTQAKEGAAEDGVAASVRFWYAEKERCYCLFLPAMAELSQWQVYSGGEEPFMVDGKTVKNGDSAAIFTVGGGASVTLGGTEYPVRVMQSANLPAVWIRTQQGSLEAIHASQDHEEPADMLLIGADGTVLYDGALTQLKGRGNATFQYKKKPYQIKLDKKTDLLGLGTAKTWVLLAEYNDYSLMRNKITFDMAAAVGVAYTPQGTWVDLYIDGEYKGLYLLSEKVQIGDNRVEIQDLEEETQAVNEQPVSDFKRVGERTYKKNTGKGYAIPNNPADITGGYLMELDYQGRYAQEASGFVTRRGQAVVIKEPEYATVEQLEYIRAHMQAFEDALRAPNGLHPDTGKHYSDYVDMASLVKKYLIEEVVKNYDGNKSSQFFYKPVDDVSQKVYAGPAWDFDIAYGNYAREYNPDFAKPEKVALGLDTGMPYYWYPAAYKQPDFYTAVVETFHKDFVPVLRMLLGQAQDPAGRVHAIDDYAALLDASAQMNRTRWPISRSSAHPVDTGTTFAENVTYLKNFIEGRMNALTKIWVQEP